MAQPHAHVGEALLRRAQQVLRDAHTPALLVVGPPGSGKSHLLARLLRSEAEAASRGQVPTPAPVRLAHADDSGTPPPRPPQQRGSPSSPLPPTAPPVPPPATPRLLVADDAEQLEPDALLRLGAALDRGAVRLALAARDGAASAEVLRRLRPVRPVVVLEVPPWQEQELAAWATSRLDAPLHEATAARLLAFSGGNALCLTELLEVGLGDGRLTRVHAVRHWRGPLEAPPRTVARLSEGLEHLPAAALDVLAAVALVGEVDLRVLEHAHSEAAVELADDAGLLDAGRLEGEVRVRLRHAVHGPVLLATTSFRRRLRLAQSLADALRAVPCTTAPRVAAQLCRSGADVPEPLLHAAVQTCLDAHDPEAARQVLQRLPPDRAAAEAGERALVRQGLLEAAAQASPDPGRRALLLALAGRAPRSEDLPADPEAALSSWRGRTAPSGAPLSGALRCVTAGHLEQAAAALARWPAAPRDEAELLVRLAVAAGHALAGAPVQARAAGDALRALGCELPWAAAHGAGALLAGLCALVAARPDEAVLRLSEAAVSLDGTALAPACPWVQALLALGQVLEGTPAGDPGPAPDGAPEAVRELTDLARAEALHARGLHLAADELAESVAGTARSGGRGLLEALALRLQARARPRRDVVDRLAGLAAVLELPQAGLWAEHADAALAGDARRLGQLAGRCRALGLSWAAVETAASADRAAGRPTAPSSASQWWRAGSVHLPALTERERQIAELVALGMSSADIAARLQVSRRTVENHLQHSYRKLGVSRRQDLVLALALQPPLPDGPAAR